MPSIVQTVPRRALAAVFAALFLLPVAAPLAPAEAAAIPPLPGLVPGLPLDLDAHIATLQAMGLPVPTLADLRSGLAASPASAPGAPNPQTTTRVLLVAANGAPPGWAEAVAAAGVVADFADALPTDLSPYAGVVYAGSNSTSGVPERLGSFVAAGGGLLLVTERGLAGACLAYSYGCDNWFEQVYFGTTCCSATVPTTQENPFETTLPRRSCIMEEFNDAAIYSYNNHPSREFVNATSFASPWSGLAFALRSDAMRVAYLVRFDAPGACGANLRILATGALRFAAGLMPPERASPPRELAIAPSAEGAPIDLSWAAPRREGGASLAGYRVTRASAEGTVPIAETTARTASDSSYAGMGHYKYRVAGVTSLGSGYAAEAEFVAPEQLTQTLPLPRGSDRYGAASVVVGDAIYMLGGEAQGAGEVPGAVVRFDLATGGAQLAATIPPRSLASAAVVDGKIILAGGARPGPAYERTDEILRFDPVTGVVETLPTRLPWPHLGGQLLPVGDALYLVGGFRRNGTQDQIHGVTRIDLAAGTATPLNQSPPGYMLGPSSFTDGEDIILGSIFPLGSSDLSLFRAIWRYDTATDTYSDTGMRHPRYRVYETVIPMGTRGVVFGGAEIDDGLEFVIYRPATYTIDPAQGRLRAEEAVPDLFHVWGNANVLGGHLVVEGGWGCPAGRYTVRCELVFGYPRPRVGPAPPTRVEATRPAMNAIEIAWDAAPGATSYIVRRVEGPGSPTIVATGAARRITDAGLPNGTRVCYEVSGVDADGEGAGSEPTCASTFAAIPPAPVRDLRAQANADWTTVAWRAPAANDGPPTTGYRAEIRGACPVGSLEQDCRRTIELPLSRPWLRDGELAIGERAYSVRAVNVVGAGEAVTVTVLHATPLGEA